LAGAMLEAKLLSVLWVSGLQAVASVESWCGHALALDDAACLYQRQMRTQEVSSRGGPKAKFDLSSLGSMMPRQLTLGEIDTLVRTYRNLTDSVKSRKRLTEEATSSLSNDAAPGELSQMVQKVTAALSSVERLDGDHLKALDFAFGKMKDNQPPMMAMATAKGEDGLKLPMQELIHLNGRARADLSSKMKSPSDLCSQASAFVSDYRKHTKRYAKACDMALYLLPPPLPPDNPWINSTLVEAMRSMYTLSKSSAEDTGDSLETSIGTFLRNGAGCELDIPDSAEEDFAPLQESFAGQQPLSLQRLQPQQSAAGAPYWPAMAVAAALAVAVERVLA